MKIKNYISKDLVIGTIGGSILATIITSIIDTRTVNKAKEELDIYKELLENSKELLKKANDEKTKAINDQDEVIKAQGLKIQELEDELKKKGKEKEAEKRKEEVKKAIEERSEIVKKAIEEKKWDDVYRLTERWYNKYPVQMSRSEVFTNLEKDGYITQEERTEAYNYFGSLWNYVGD